MNPRPRNKRQGQWLEKEIGMINDAYRLQNIAKIHKVSPPSIVIYNPVLRVVMLENPYLDYIGTWTSRDGRTISIEAKSTEKPSLTICQDGGITDRQYAALHAWHQSGAAVGVLWGYQERIRFVTIAALTSQIQAGVKHIKWDQVQPIPTGLGFITHDYIRSLAENCD